MTLIVLQRKLNLELEKEDSDIYWLIRNLIFENITFVDKSTDHKVFESSLFF